jgi:glycerol-3-phosphate dehydrogenase
MGIAARLFPAARQLEPISAYSSLRPLLQDKSGSPTAASRGHRIWKSPDGIVHVAGGKYTTYRAMSEEAVDKTVEDIAPALKTVHLTGSTPLQAAGLVPAPGSQDWVPYSVHHEMAQRLMDLLFVSTYWGYEQRWSRESLRPYAEEMGKLCGWDQARQEEEIETVLTAVQIPVTRP